MRKWITLLLLSYATGLSAQQPKGTWLMAYVKALQPVYTMVEVDGEYQLDESVPQDSSFLYNSGLMVIEFGKKNKAISHSWDGKENWTIKIDQNKIQLFGERDTLFGEFNQKQIIVSSTLDDRPTFYHFEQLDVKKFSTFSLSEGEWSIDLENHHLSDLITRFTYQSIDSTIEFSSNKSKLYFTYVLDKLQAIEYDFPPSQEKDLQQELSTIYFFKSKRKGIIGVFYPITDGLDVPERKSLRLIPKSR